MTTAFRGVALAALLASTGSAQVADGARTLRLKFGLGESEIALVDRGAVVTRRLSGLAGDEVAFIGALRLRASAVPAASRVFALDLPAESRSLILRAGFSRAPSESDLRLYKLPTADVDALRDCVVGACVLKLSGDAIAALRRLDWSAADISEQSSSVIRRWLLAYVQAYGTRGNEALVVYEDGRTPLALHEGFHTLLAAMPFWGDDAPEFHHYLDVFPRQPLAGVRDTISWYLEDFGLRPLTTVVHSALYLTPERSSSPVRALVARKQIFASHYFRARLSMLAFVETTAAPAASTQTEGSRAGSYFLWLDRSLFDAKLNRFIRGRVEGRLEEDLRSRLTLMQRALLPSP